MTSFPDSHHDLLTSTGVAVLATIGPSGRPQVTAVWYVLESDGALHLSLNGARQKTKNLLANSATTLFFIDPANPFRTREIRAHAVVAPDDGYDLADRVGAKHGADLRHMDQPGDRRYAVRLEPLRVRATP